MHGQHEQGDPPIATPQETGPKRFLGIGRKAWGVLAAVAAVVIPIIAFGKELAADWGTRDASVDSVTATAHLNLFIPGAYAVPVDAPFDTLPTELEPSPDGPYKMCGEQQHRWLAKYGNPFADNAIINLRSTAEAGPLISVSDFTTSGRTVPAPVPLIPVYCTAPIGGTIDVPHGALQADGKSVALLTTDPEEAPTSPAAFNLEPGEKASLVLDFKASRNFEGSLMATVSSGDQEKPIQIDVDENNDTIFVPDFSRTDGFEVLIADEKGGPLLCREGEVSESCTAPEIIQRLKEFQR